jgi:hypothetical protein
MQIKAERLEYHLGQSYSTLSYFAQKRLNGIGSVFKGKQ